MVCGESGSGKTTFCLTLFNKYLTDRKKLQGKGPAQTLSIEEIGCFELKTTTNQPCFVHLYDSRGYGDFINNKDAVQEVKRYIIRKHLDWLNIRGQETSEDDRAQQDERIHLIFYFFAPHRYKEIDKVFLSELTHVANIVPVVGKSDTMTVDERRNYLVQLRDLLNTLKVKNGVNIFDFHEDAEDREFIPDPFSPSRNHSQPTFSVVDLSQHINDSPRAYAEEIEQQEDKASTAQSDDEVIVESTFHSNSSQSTPTQEKKELSSSVSQLHSSLSAPLVISQQSTQPRAEPLPKIPNVFAICCDSNTGYRVFPWGTVETENPAHSDVPRLRSLVFEKGYINQFRSLTQSLTTTIYRQQQKNQRRQTACKSCLLW
eukprot:CAMPEP_0173142156 /NCGR_PEP_ID=MMETSP1105-20130129/5924_1 /TAXON_ID=2985 /ORGANISM="Ochromonas sp., Strain BG-1" /LENGTH=372 /DNA_ID=CAMNT_0014055501 /DNA_START=91 /DNA_END=1206 /DNA_ORIENTATION=-